MLFPLAHNNQSWLSALTAVLDTTALLVSGIQGLEARQAQLTFAMARHAVVDLAQVFSLQPSQDSPDRLPAERYQQLYAGLCQSGVRVCRDELSSQRLREMRGLYEGYAEALSRHLAMPLPPWITDHAHKDNWQTVAKLRAQTEAADGASSPDAHAERAARILSAPIDRYHDF